MELQEAIAAYREQIKHVLSQKDPPPSEEWLDAEAERLLAVGARDTDRYENGSGSRAAVQAGGSR